MLIISPDTLMVVGTSTIGASGLLTVYLPVNVIGPLSLEEVFLVRRMRLL
jgi:NhaP-type Na+/H+ and K+/H+ antiporter